MPFEGPQRRAGFAAILDARAVRALCLALPLVAAVVGGAALFQAGANPAPPTEIDPIDLGGLPEIRSQNGVLEATLVAAPLQVHVGSATFMGAGFNGVYGGPVLRVHPGDRIRIHLINNMSDGINLHFHGLRVTPLGRGDNVHILVAPGASFDYDFRLPANHPPGLFWYHDHAHHDAEAHVMAGLSGAFLIEGFASRVGGLHAMKQELLVLKDWQHNDCTAPELKRALHCRVISINGNADWQDSLATGESQLWRVSNQGADLVMHIAAPGLAMRIVGRDSMPASGAPETNGFDIMPASRLDVVVRADAPGTYPLVATNVPTTGPAGFSVRRPLGSVTVTGKPGTISAPALNFPHEQDMRAWHIDARRTIVFSENLSINEFYVNGLKFNPTRTDIRTPLGNVEEWIIKNVTDDFHEFHIHQLSFQVTEVNGVRQPFTGYVDDVNVPENGDVKLIIPFTDPNIIGHLMVHCHVLNHEDLGMMTMLEVYRPGIPHICKIPERQ
jgi:suppressor of ftsI